METPFLVEQKTFQDERGNFCATPFLVGNAKSLVKNWVQVNTSVSFEKYTTWLFVSIK